MALAVYSQRFFASGALTHGAGVVGPVVPAGVVWVLRDIDIQAVTGSGADQVAAFNQVGGYLYYVTLPSSPTVFNYQWRGRQVYAEGERIGFESFAGTWSLAASGYQLTLP